MALIHYHIERPGPRSRYILAHVLGGMTGWIPREVEDLDAFRQVAGPKLIYGHGAVDGAVRIMPHGLLEERGIPVRQAHYEVVQGMPVLYPINGGLLPFDIFSAAFHLLSRAEEHGPIPRDEHGRPLTRHLQASVHGYLDRPLVDEWMQMLLAAWRTEDPGLPNHERTYAQVATMDADNGAMYLGRPWWRSVGSAARDLVKGRPTRVRDRIAVLAGSRPDPYAVHAAFVELARGHGALPIINFLASPRSAHDHAVPLRTPYIKEVLRHTAEQAVVGLHPGYGSSGTPGQIAVERKALESAAGIVVMRSRQHYLRMRLPETVRELVDAGIREDHSMGLADAVGFRAGTCTPFPFYDLGAEQPLPIMMHPFAVMDSAMAYKMGLPPEEAVAKACRIADAVRSVHGTFITVWHERFLSNYGDEAGWGRVAPEVIAYARP